jgi:hypothetical protein
MDIEILNQARLVYWCRRLDFPSAAVDELTQLARTVCEDETLLALFSAFHEKTALRGEWHKDWAPLPFDAQVQAALGQRTALFYLLAYLAALPYAEKEYRRRGIPARIFDDTMSDIRRYLLVVYDLEGRWGFREFMWIWLHLTCELFRLGRLQFRLAPFEGKVTGFRNKNSRRTLLLADPNMKLRSDGYALGAGRIKGNAQSTWVGQPADPGAAESEAWLPAFEESPSGWKGHLVSPYGNVLSEATFLPRQDWECVLKHEDTVLDMHIPPHDAFTAETCRAALRQAFDFFAQQSPEKTIRAGFCHTWFFTHPLQEFLPAESHIVQFQREFYLYPHPGGPGFLWEYTFGEKYRDLATAPGDTRLRRAVLDWLGQGKELFDLPGVFFHGPEEWGSQPYMRAWDAGVISCQSSVVW